MTRILLILLSSLIAFLPTMLVAEKDLFKQDSEQQSFTQGQLEQMLAPIALYPDSVLTHILIASTYPIEIIQANRWLKKHSNLSSGDALNKVENKKWDPSVKALIPFPKILKKLSENLEWAQNLGDAFLQNEKRVLVSIQSLRRKADQAGNLDKMEHMEISRKNKNIIIQPIKREVVYVPYYDSRTIYGNWHWINYPPVYWNWHHHHTYHRPFHWHSKVHLSFNYFHSAFHWHNHHIIVVDRHHYNSRRYRHRNHIFRDHGTRHWNHNPTHRRGVAYRTENIRQRYRSTRPSINQTRAIRNNERRLVVNSRTNTNNNRRSELSRRENTRTISRNITNRTIHSNHSSRQTSRHQRLRQQLNLTHTQNNQNRQVDRSRQVQNNQQNSVNHSNSTASVTHSRNRQLNHQYKRNRAEPTRRNLTKETQPKKQSRSKRASRSTDRRNENRNNRHSSRSSTNKRHQ